MEEQCKMWSMDGFSKEFFKNVLKGSFTGNIPAGISNGVRWKIPDGISGRISKEPTEGIFQNNP